METMINDIAMHWRESGSGEPVLLVHGFPFDGGLWEGQLGRLPLRWRWLAPDLRGFGKSSLGDGTGPLGMDLLADDLAAFLDALGIDRAVVCGHSMGGYVAFALLRWHPARVRALVLVDSRAGADTEEAKAARRELATRIRQEGAAAAADALLPKLLAESTWREKPEVVARARALIEAQRTETLVRALEGMAERLDSTDLLPRIAVPALILVGAEDRLTPAAEAELMARAIPEARLQVIEDAAHLPNLENPATFERNLVHFLEAIQGH